MPFESFKYPSKRANFWKLKTIQKNGIFLQKFRFNIITFKECNFLKLDLRKGITVDTLLSNGILDYRIGYCFVDEIIFVMYVIDIHQSLHSVEFDNQNLNINTWL